MCFQPAGDPRALDLYEKSFIHYSDIDNCGMQSYPISSRMQSAQIDNGSANQANKGG